jgi:hypothetical protein
MFFSSGDGRHILMNKSKHEKNNNCRKQKLHEQQIAEDKGNL